VDNELLDIETRYWSMRLTVAAEEAFSTTLFYATGAIDGLWHQDFITEAQRDMALFQFAKVVADRRGEPVPAEPTPRSRITWRTAALFAGSLSLGLVAGIYVEEWMGMLLTVACLVLGGDQ
jgi:hypothetical protein|tara:strand:- start:4885 stop:5247 length:363 start_codon:yes stop_codon:yes gene_type:complete